jgi:hypothetical protein
MSVLDRSIRDHVSYQDTIRSYSHTDLALCSVRTFCTLHFLSVLETDKVHDIFLQIIVVILTMADTRNSAKFAFTHVSCMSPEGILP